MMGILLKFYPFQADFPDDLSEDPLDNVELLQDHLEFFPYLCRYQITCFIFSCRTESQELIDAELAARVLQLSNVTDIGVHSQVSNQMQF
ncbi:hypothetical protein B296_00032455 [Ensete ventricosum]|uniref:Exportin-7/Ran-binding protein 17 TPR repeats domain-containing protein n=1 Tax=Ensete ventricosum TaxID=4639 RepID=A0A427ADR3_ENSVE|nr:hypothetical protein B296_00032455 [Ensete ventricosum]